MNRPVSKRQRYQQSEAPRPMRFQTRDGEILQAIFEYGGVLARRHIKTMFWPTASWKAMERRLTILYQNGYVDWPNAKHRRTRGIPEPIVWLGWKGALQVAAREGIFLEGSTFDVQSMRETQLRGLQQKLRENGFRWMRLPRWLQLAHDLKGAVDFRLAVEGAIADHPDLRLEQWINEGEFLSRPDKVEYRTVDDNGRNQIKKKLIRPDSFFVVVDSLNEIRGSPVRRRFLLELDMGTHPRPRFAQEKALPGAAYIRSEAYKKRFAYNSGRWLVVTTGKVRRDHLMQHTRMALGSDARVFLFTTLQQVSAETVLTSPIWKVPGKVERVSLFSVG